MGGESAVTLFLCGDVMLGRGVDQILPHPGDPTLWEEYVGDARAYVALAEAAHGPVPRPAAPSWPWGVALPLLDEAAPGVRVVNLETSVTRRGTPEPGKAVHYRMTPENLPSLAAARPDVCVLANNHVLDFGRQGLLDTLDALAAAGLRTAGAGRDLAGARRPAAVPLPGPDGGRRVLVFACGMPSSGVPEEWAAAPGRPGVDLVPAATGAAAGAVVRRVRRARRPGDLVVVSVHWGSNWGYGVTEGQVRFAHALVDGGVDVVHGHSSHHPRPLEVYRGKLVLYGCGDLVDDYEGITGYEEYRDDLRLLYLAALEPDTGRLAALRMAPVRARRLRLEQASDAERDWLRATLDRVSRGFGVRVVAESRERGGMLRAVPVRPPS
ncbi:CapA family protein [Streptomyces roseolilacinus]|uniref:Polyglutamine synthesis accessory protein n=1 Tax=Streptomyces roseolilacinus TaxID=66904 RepID=A0A918AZT1_9ACTN|nr:CapA family protein [Streptomyces roseolilacinus]GGQ07667.1 putative polyglutamine synthesis accessory protein [Streptomyces roseolilacinus]